MERIPELSLWPPVLINAYDPPLQPVFIVVLGTILICLLLWLFPLTRWLVAGMVIVFMGSRAVGGFDKVELALHGYMVGKLQTTLSGRWETEKEK